jgi:ERCC4-type nuclease
VLLLFPFIDRRSPQQTSEIFRAIMINHDEVDIQKAIAVGNLSNLDENGFNTDSTDNNNMNDSSEREYYRYSAQEILLSLPGINSQNYREILNSSKIRNLTDLSQMKEKEFVPFIGPVNAKKLYEFFHHKQ